MSLRVRSLFLSVALFALTTPAVHAAPYGFPDPLNNADVPTLINRIVTQVLGIIGALFFIMFLWGGFQYMTAGGDAKKVGNARRTLVNTVIGMMIVASAYAITVNLINAVAVTGSNQSTTFEQPVSEDPTEDVPPAPAEPPDLFDTPE